MVTSSHAPRSADGSGGEPNRNQKHPACDLYVPGHLVHYIQARRASGSDDPVRWGRYGGIENGRLVVRFLDETRRYRIHRPDEVTLVAEVGDKVRVSERWHLASVTRRFEQLCTVCIALPDDPWQPCSVASGEPSSFEELVDRMIDRGGFVAPGRLLTGLIAQETEGGDDPSPDGGLPEVS